MENIQPTSRTADTIFYLLARMLERGTYYGIRSIIIIYMMSETIQMENMQAYKMYGLITAFVVIAQFFGGIMGDVWLGNKKAIIVGGILQAIGAFVFCIPSINALYVGIFFVVLGGGLFTPNLSANYGKLFVNTPRKLDSAFTAYYLIVNIGAFVGVLLFGLIEEKFSFSMAFATAGILMIASIFPVLLVNEKKLPITQPNIVSQHRVIIYFLCTFFLVAVFWFVSDVLNYRMYDIQNLLAQIETIKLPKNILYYSNSFGLTLFAVLAIIAWLIWYSSPFFKIFIGLKFALLAVAVMFYIPTVPAEQHLQLYFLALVFITLSEIHIAPIIFSIVTRYSNPKYLAILLSLVSLPAVLANMVNGHYGEFVYDEPVFMLRIIAVIIIISTVITGLLTWWYHRTHEEDV